MNLLQSLRTAPRLAFAVLLWFALTLAAAVAAPLLQAQDGMVICSASGPVQRSAVGGGPATGSTLHCPLCLLGIAPPPAFSAAPGVLHASGPRAGWHPADVFVASYALPAPPRGPPLA